MISARLYPCPVVPTREKLVMEIVRKDVRESRFEEIDLKWLKGEQTTHNK